MGLPVWTRQLWPRPMMRPSWTSTEPIGMPPPARLLRACSIAASRKGSRGILSLSRDRRPYDSRDLRMLVKFPVGLRKHIARTGDPYVQRRKQEDVHQHCQHQAADDHDRERP